MIGKPTPNQFPIDIVYTWVNDQDAHWQSKKARFVPTKNNADSCGEGRFKNSDELKYSLRSIDKYCSWVNKIFIVTDEQIPSWINVNHPKVQIVDHKSIFPDISVLPTFNSLAIESCLHLIPNLSEHFIYLNDDFFVGRPLSPNFFFSTSGQEKLFVTKKKYRFTPHKLLQSNDSMTLYHQVINFARKRIFEHVDKIIRNEPTHVAKCFSKSQLVKLEQMFIRDIEKTRSHKTRENTDIYLAALDSFYQQANGANSIQLKRLKSIPWFRIGFKKRWEQTYVHVNLSVGEKKLKKIFNVILSTRPSMFCINDGEKNTQIERELMVRFLKLYFSNKSQFEN